MRTPVGSMMVGGADDPEARVGSSDIERDREKLLRFMRKRMTPEIQQMIEMALAVQPPVPKVEIVISTEGTTDASEK